MSIDLLRNKIDIERGASLSSFEIKRLGATNLIETRELDAKALGGFIAFICTLNCTTELEGYYESDKVKIDIPITEGLLKAFGHPLITVNFSRDESTGWELFHLMFKLAGSRDSVPHFLRLEANLFDLSDQELETQEKLTLHSMDLKTFDKRAQVIAISTYIEAMVTIVSEKSLATPEFRESWRERVRPKKANGKRGKITPNFSTHIEHLKENGILTLSLCDAVDKLRLARNVSAHNYKIFKGGEGGSPVDHIEVTHLDEEFISKSREFIAVCKDIFGAIPKALGSNKFQRYSEILAGEISKSTSLESVLVLGVRHSDEVEEIFG
ncbi:hypothetical protein [Pseudomonas sp. 7-41]|uniref:hypothetical protein n=1 Tax=Pseudomonas sp. 7-41 TaxID=2898483 RepID=UPI001E4BADC7|nr:hypothetical protein [Pseudomonas sp. 7-41]UHG95134.1 hypothetical protein LQ249_15540 [Pseudomonas sp. 7-41]